MLCCAEQALGSSLPVLARHWDPGGGTSALLPCTKEAPDTLLIRNGSASLQGSLPVTFRAVGWKPAHHSTLIPGGSAVPFLGRHGGEGRGRADLISDLMALSTR